MGRRGIDLSGSIVGTIKVIKKIPKEEAPWKSHSTPYLCKCQECGREWVSRKEDIVKGCAPCKMNNGIIPFGGRGYKSISAGDRFGKLVVLEYETGRKTTSGKPVTYIKCKCDCGNIISVRKDHLTGYNKGNGQGVCHTVSCGCGQVFAGESKITELLNKANVKYKTQYIIPELSNFMKFDFAVFDAQDKLQYLIEYDGIQHYRAIDRFGGEEKLNIQKERDARKNAFCKEKGIPLIRIPYVVKLLDLKIEDVMLNSVFQI